MKRKVKENMLFANELTEQREQRPCLNGLCRVVTEVGEANLSVREHIAKLIEMMSQGLYEKEHIMAVALLSAIAGESIFLLGPP